MSYNIDTWNLKNIVLVLPKDFSFKEQFNERWGDEDTKISDDGKTWTFNQDNDNEGLEMGGVVTERGLVVQRLICAGEGSGHDYNILVALVATYKGFLQAGTIWEGGDSVFRVIMDKDGEDRENVEI